MYRELARSNVVDTQLTKDNLARAIEQGYSHREIAAIFGVSHATITRRLMAWDMHSQHAERFPERRGIPQPPRKRRRRRRKAS
jgi:transposase